MLQALPINAQEREQGMDIRSQNATATNAIAHIVKSSLGPQGLDKMLVDEVGEVTITNDGATILKLLEVDHPAAKILVELAQTQDQAVGDGTTSVVIVAAELLRRANELIKNKVHATSVISGYKLACKKGIEYVKDKLRIETSGLGRDALINVAKTSMASKVLGPESEYFGNIVVDAITSVKSVSASGKDKYSVKSVKILKVHGKSARESQFVKNGYVLLNSRAAQGMPKKISKAKIAFLDMNLQKQKMKMGVQVVINDPNQLTGVQDREITLIRDRIQMVLKSGANVVFVSKAIDDLCLKYFVEAGVIACRRCSREDLRSMAKLTGGTVITTFANLEGGESFENSWLGEADEVAEERVGDYECMFVRGCKTTKACSILLRGATDFLLDEMERTLHDALSACKRVLESKFVVPGGGSVETALSVALEHFATTIETREQLAIAEFAESMLVIPKTLAVNSALDATELVAKLRAYHNEAYTNDTKKAYARYGLELIEGKVVDNVEAGVLEPALTKMKILQFATEAATTILRIDDLIRLAPKQKANPQDYE